jgi:ribonuclease P/MRP protein subunit POP5
MIVFRNSEEMRGARVETCFLWQMKPLLPTLKEKKRYIGFSVISKAKLSEQSISSSIHSGLLSYLGSHGMGCAGAAVLKVQGKMAILRVNTQYVNHAKAAMTLMHKIGSNNVIIKSERVSGTLKQLKKKLYGEAS